MDSIYSSYIAHSLFLFSLAVILFTYFGYPLILYVLNYLSPSHITKIPYFPTVTVLIAAHNEESCIGQRLTNIFQQDYPKHLIEIIVISDGSSDNTASISAGYKDHGVQVLELKNKGGKAAALNAGVSISKGEIIVFTDSRQVFRNDAITKLTENFSDSQIGCVSGELVFIENSTSLIEAEMGAYWKYEKMVRRLESTTGSVVGATGCIYAILRDLYQPLPVNTILDDVLTPMNIVAQGKRVIFEPLAIAYDAISKDVQHEWRRKVRTLAGNWQLLGLAPWLIVPWSNNIWWRYVSHKLLRLFVPFLLILILLTSFVLTGTFYLLFTFAQIILYLIVIIGFMFPVTRTIRFVNLCCFFIIMNAAVLVGFWKWAAGRSSTIWQK